MGIPIRLPLLKIRLYGDTVPLSDHLAEQIQQSGRPLPIKYGETAVKKRGGRG